MSPRPGPCHSCFSYTAGAPYAGDDHILTAWRDDSPVNDWWACGVKRLLNVASVLTCVCAVKFLLEEQHDIISWYPNTETVNTRVFVEP